MAWWPQTQRAWRLSDDDRGWRADVAFVVEYEWGRGKHMPCLTPGAASRQRRRGRHRATLNR